MATASTMDAQHHSHQAFQLLHIGFTIAPIEVEVPVHAAGRMREAHV